MRQKRSYFMLGIAWIVTILALVYGVNAYPSVTMIENTPACFDCHTTYLICSQDDVKSFDIAFMNSEGRSVSMPYVIEKHENKEIIETITTWSKIKTKVNTSNGTRDIDEVIPSMTDKASIKEIKTQISKSDMKTSLKKDSCVKISVSGKIGFNQAIDNILVIDNHAYTEFAWWNSSFNYIRPIFINSTVNSNLANFPAYISLNTTALISAGKMNSTCKDIRIVYNNASVLPYEIENCNSSTTIIWFSVPTLTAGTTDHKLSLYYGNNQATDMQNATGLWSEYAGVWHGRSSGTDGYFYSSAPGLYNLSAGGSGGTSVRMINESAKCKFGSCVEFNSTTGYLEVSGLFNATPNARGFTLSAWGYRMNNNTVTEACVIGSMGSYADFNTRYLVIDSEEKYVTAHTQGVARSAKTYIAGNRNQLNYFAGVWDLSGKSRSFINLAYSTLDTTSATSTSNYLRIGGGSAGNWGWAQNSNIGATLDEVRMTRLDINRSIDWMAAEYGLISSVGSESISVNPSVVFDSISPVNLTLFNTITNRINITFNLTDVNMSSFRLRYSTNNSDNVKDVVNGTQMMNPQEISCTNITASTMKCQLGDNMILRGVYNYPEDAMENYSHVVLKTFNNANDRLKTQILTNFSQQATFVFLEFMCNGTGTAPMNVYFYNSTNQSVLIASVPANSSYDHRHSVNSAHHVIGIPINQTDYSILGVKITPTLYIEIRGSSGASFSCYGISDKTRDNAVLSSINGGSSYSEVIGTTDLHYHRFGNNTYFRYTGVARADSDGLNYTSGERSDLLEFFVLPPTTPMLDAVNSQNQNTTQLISWNPSQSPQGSSITAYHLKLYDANDSFIETLIDTSSLSYLWNMTQYSGLKYLGISATDSANLTSGEYRSNIFNITIPCYANYTCSGFAACQANNVSVCLGVIDLNSCGVPYPGNITDFDQSCVYTPTFMQTFDPDTLSGTALIFVIAILWIGVYVLAFTFRSRGFMVFGLIIGIFLGLLLINISPLLTFLFIAGNGVIGITTAKRFD